MTDNLMAEIIDKVAAKADAALAPQNDEYLDETDGLLHCVTCGEKRQTRTKEIPELGISARIVRCTCSCHRAEERQREEQKRKEVIERRRSLCFRGTNMKSWTFANDDRKRPQLSDALARYAENFSQYCREGKGLLLYGPVGTGKTYLAACVANAVIDKGYTAYMTNFATVSNELFDTNAKQEYINSLCGYDLLILDDLGTERKKSEYMQELVFNIIDARYRSGLPLLITTNLTPAELTNAAEIGNSRIYDRVLERCLAVKVEGTSRRRQIVKRDWNEMRQQLGMEA